MRSGAQSEMENVSRTTHSVEIRHGYDVSRSGRYWFARLRYGMSACSVGANGIDGERKIGWSREKQDWVKWKATGTVIMRCTNKERYTN